MRWFYLFLLIFCIPAVYGLSTCGGVVDVNTTCFMVTPTLSCSSYTYNVSNSSQVQVDYGILSNYSGSGLYYFNFSMSYEDMFLVQLCDGSIRQIEVSNGGDEMFLGFLIILPLLFGFGLLYWANTLDDELKWIKLLFRLLFIPLFLLSLRFGLAGITVIYPADFEFTELIADTTFYVSWLLYIVGACLLLYIVWMMVQMVLNKKVEKDKEKYGEE